MNDLCDADTVFFCEMRNILGMKFDTLKMTVGNFDFWNETKQKKDQFGLFEILPGFM